MAGKAFDAGTFLDTPPDPEFYRDLAAEALQKVAASGRWDGALLQEAAEHLAAVSWSEGETFLRDLNHGLLLLLRGRLDEAYHTFCRCLGINGAALILNR